MEQHRITSVLVVDADGCAGGCAELERPDARKGDLTVTRPALTFRARAAAAGAARAGRRSSMSTACSPTGASTSVRTAARTFKAFSTLDGHGLKLLGTGRHRADRHHRARFARGAAAGVADLGLVHAAYRRRRQARRGAARPAGRRSGCAWSAVAAMGDDWPRPAAARRARPSPAPRPVRHAEVRALAHHVTTATGRAWRGTRMLRPADGRVGALRRAAAGSLALTLDATA